MTNYPMLACASALLVCTAVGCGGAPETTEEAAPAAAPAAAPVQSVFGETEEGGERPRLVAPVRGEAQLGYTQPVVKNGTIDGREYVVTTIRVKNMADGAIAGLQVDEFWYDSAGNPVHRRQLSASETSPA